MAISSGDILFRFSTTLGSSGNSNVGSGAGSLGKYVSQTNITDNTLNNLFGDISGDQNAASVIDYRAIFIVNSNPSGLVMQNTVAWFSAEVSGGATVQMAIDNILPSSINSASLMADTIANSTTAPTAVGAFSFPVTKGTALSLGNISSGSGRAIWIKRSAANTVAVNNDGCTIQVACDSAA